VSDWTSSLRLNIRENTFVAKDVTAFQDGGGVGNFRVTERTGFVGGGVLAGEGGCREIEGLGCGLFEMTGE